MAMLKDEVSILKAQCIQVDDSTAVIVTQQYHTEPNEQGKTDRQKSKYRWIGMVAKIADIKKLIADLSSDANRLKKWRWPNDPDPWYICSSNESAGYAIAKFFENKLKKMRSWEEGQQFLRGWETQTKNRDGAYNSGAVYPTDFKTVDGVPVDLTDKDSILKQVGKTIYREHIMKSKLPPVKSAK